MRDVTDLQPNPDKPGWYFGFVVVNTTSNVVHDIYPGHLEAVQESKRLGPDFQALGGGYCPKDDLYEYFQAVVQR